MLRHSPLKKINRFSAVAAAAAAAALCAGVALATVGPDYFGSNLNSTIQPSNAGNGQPCQIAGGPCTWVLNEAYGAPGREGAPHDGTIRKLRLIAQSAGKFKLQVVKVNAAGEVTLKANGPMIEYIGQEGFGGGPEEFRVEKFDVNVPVKEGQYLAFKARKTSTLRCSSGGDNNLQLSPPLSTVGEQRAPDAEDGCWLLIEAKVS